MNFSVKLYQKAKQLHRWLVLMITAAAAIMAWTGMVLKWPVTFISWGVNVAAMRTLHGQFSTVFAILLFIMVITGLYLYFFPLWQTRQAKQRQASSSTVE